MAISWKKCLASAVVGASLIAISVPAPASAATSRSTQIDCILNPVSCLPTYDPVIKDLNTFETLRVGTTHPAVASFKWFLKIGTGNDLGTSETFTKANSDAVKRLQTMFGLTADGVVGPKTWKLVITLYNRKLEPNAPAIAASDVTITKGFGGWVISVKCAPWMPLVQLGHNGTYGTKGHCLAGKATITITYQRGLILGIKPGSIAYLDGYMTNPILGKTDAGALTFVRL